MKKIFNILLLAVFTLSVFTACEKDDDSNLVHSQIMVFRLLQHTVFRWRLILNLQKRQKKVKQTIPN